jgi:hypothetical protein
MNARDGACGQKGKIPMSWVCYVPTALHEILQARQRI